MASLDDLYRQKRKYERFSDDIENIISNLNKAISCIEDAVDFCGSNFKIDGVSADSFKISKIKNKLINNRDDLRDKVYPAIKKAISDIKNDISVAESM